MKWTSKSRTVLIMSGLVALMAAPVSAEKMKARLAQSISPLAAIATVAKAKDFYGKNGLDIEVSYFTSGKRSLAAVMGGGPILLQMQSLRPPRQQWQSNLSLF